MSSPAPSAIDSLVFRKTNTKIGRHLSVTPSNSSMRHLAYGRILLNASHPSESFSTGDRETGLVCLSGHTTVTVDGQASELDRYDAIYIPRDSSVRVTATSDVDLAEFSADVAHRYPLQIVRSAEVAKDPSLKFSTGGPTSTRHLHMLFVKNVQAGRLLLGITSGENGHWTSWPPHEHAVMLEELYVYINMPEPAYGIQLVYNNTEYPEFLTVVREGDAVLIPGGYHPNVAVPGHPICYLWAMAAHREGADRQFGVFNVQPGFQPPAPGSRPPK